MLLKCNGGIRVPQCMRSPGAAPLPSAVRHDAGGFEAEQGRSEVVERIEQRWTWCVVVLRGTGHIRVGCVQPPSQFVEGCRCSTYTAALIAAVTVVWDACWVSELWFLQQWQRDIFVERVNHIHLMPTLCPTSSRRNSNCSACAYQQQLAACSPG